MNRTLLFSVILFLVISGAQVLGAMIFAEPLSEGRLAGALLGTVIFAFLLHRYPALASPWVASKVNLEVKDAQDIATPDIDPVTGVMSLRSVTISLLESMALAERYQRDLSLVQVVIDDFASVQARFGAKGVDAALSMVGSTLLTSIRIPDRVGRYSTNAFILVLPETDIRGAQQIAERVRRAVVEEEVRSDKGERFSMTISAGVTTFKSGDDPNRIIDRAELAVAHAAELGSNRTAMYADSED